MELVIDENFKRLIPPLSSEERQQLEFNLVEYGGARDPLVAWRLTPRQLHAEGYGVCKECCDGGVVPPDEWQEGDGNWECPCGYGVAPKKAILIDGHNRFEICQKRSLPYSVEEVNFVSREAAEDWIDKNQLGRRNLHPDAFTLLLGRRYNRTKRAQGGTGANQHKQSPQSGDSAKTSVKLAREHGVSKNTVERAGKFAESVEKAKAIDPQIETKVASGTAPPKAAVVKAAALLEKAPEKAIEIIRGEKKMADVVRDEKRAEIVAKLEDVQEKTAKALSGVYDVIVIDPPWPMEKIERDVRPNQTEFDYPVMQEDELRMLNIPCASDCHVWVWTTHKFMRMAFRLLEAWSLKYVCTFVWHKPGGFQPIGLPQYNCEFAIYARKGSPQFIDTKAFPTCFAAPRGKHSEKPEEFYEVIRRVTAGRRLDMFNRRAIDGFDVWGKEAE